MLELVPATIAWLMTTAACGFMTGLIWFVQIVHYPLFAKVGEDRFQAYAASHQALTTFVVGPVMLIELVGGIWLTALLIGGDGPVCVCVIAAAALLGLVWASTFVVQVPLHAKLSGGFDQAAHRRLVRSNWVRTFGWTARLGVLLWLATV